MLFSMPISIMLKTNPPEETFRGEMEPLVGIEPTTYSLRMNCSTV